MSVVIETDRVGTEKTKNSELGAAWKTVICGASAATGPRTGPVVKSAAAPRRNGRVVRAKLTG